ncbi:MULTISPECIES: FAD-dependent oxidoreductase [Aneurinibacillus]|uniref:Electron transfer flavoprotein-quinone oxidoreductase n=1 Tax=Aneurinibacillus thermoaerophilus TaxID=143495 RepID=A0A1G7YMR0_ANETH|nr:MULTISPECIES: FAD-dependent oxidoreductase [Aneurinibacillus]AMA73807.1 nitrogen fixation protein FixC [Aneurinibacillus sp. XH2]MED0676641.1 FAD-dependent oxidoreductase [Aneurinibacillus thermoaerophilus]MED0679372.1 FAD-dependent oxidoreductase [Aneurinibacillus thermoaerophilus]MED0738057.1 FAD-dependent oxidoreductase [Aneurinibacillus thermoaerophilus]MED0756478.1 FAD-dependent oxidoreductase [Aneurinibacillus thermoaerophilus]
MSEKFDAIVVGAGPAGTSAAYTMAKAGLNVLVIERGEYPGAKNVMGGVLYRHQMEEMIPGFYKEAPVERPVVEQRFWFLGEESVFTGGYKGLEWAKEPYNNFTVLRAKFDQWYASKAVEQGALLINETVVTECIVEDGRVVGVRTDRPDGDVYADVVVLADGVNSLLAKSLGFHKEFKPDQVALAVMEVLNLPAEKIEDRFNLEPNQGATIEIFGDATKGVLGTGFIYTNKESINIGVGATLSGIIKHRLRPYDLLEYLKKHPIVRPLIRGGEPMEYAAHLIPEGGFHAMPKIVGNGVMVVGDAGQMVNSVHREGSNMAMTSGRLAAETIILAKEANDFSENMLDTYRVRLLDSFVGQDLKKYKDATHTFENYPQYFKEYIPMINKAASQFFTVDGVPKKEKQKKILKSLMERKSKLSMVQDIYRAWKVMK